jgi:hypothetical protein
MRLQLRCHGDIDLSQPGMQRPGERPRIGQDTRASHVRVWVTQEVDLLGPDATG